MDDIVIALDKCPHKHISYIPKKNSLEEYARCNDCGNIDIEQYVPLKHVKWSPSTHQYSGNTTKH